MIVLFSKSIHRFRRKSCFKGFLNFINVISILFQNSIGLKSLLQQELSEPEFNGDLVYKFRTMYACNDFSTQSRKIILRYIKIGYNIITKRQTACMVVNPITVNNFVSLFGCTPAGRASDSMTAPA